MGQSIGLKGLDSMTKKLKGGPKSDKSASANMSGAGGKGGKPSRPSRPMAKAGGLGRRGLSKGSYTASKKSGTARRQTGRV